MKISSVQFFDYRAFLNGSNNQYNINVREKNLLIYGENGSGKTSFYRGLKDFFHRADFTSHNQSPRLNEGYIEIHFSNGNMDRYEESGSKPSTPEVVSTPKLNSFLSYKELLKIHFVDREDINLFDFLINGLLGDHILESLGNLKAAWEIEIHKNIDTETDDIIGARESGFLTDEEASEQIEIAKENLNTSRRNFSDEVNGLLGQINIRLNKILGYFKQNLEVELKLDEINWEALDNARIGLAVKYFGNPADSYHEFLNEARLSALAISIYFAAIASNPTENAVKVLFLDDIFLGLDMGNRLPLLQILNSEFKDWQIFLTTYDRHWFEVARHYLDTANWLFIEMYAVFDDKNQLEVPTIYYPSLNYLEKALYYFKKGDKDYPAAGNYLRKEFERVLKNFLYGKYLFTIDGKTGIPKPIDELGELWINFSSSKTSLLKSLDFNTSLYEDFEIVSKTVLNPLSHDNLDKPIYKGELETAFKLLDKLRAIEKVTIIEAGDILKIVTFNNGIERETFIRILEEIIAFKQTEDSGNGKINCRLGCPVYRVQPIEYKEPAITKNLSHLRDCDIKKAYDLVYFDVYGIKNASSLPGFNLNDEFIHVKSGLTIQVILSSV